MRENVLPKRRPSISTLACLAKPVAAPPVDALYSKLNVLPGCEGKIEHADGS